MDSKNVLVIPCSGIGKVHGLISREATYEVTDNLAKDQTNTLCLALLVMGDETAVSKVKNSHCITIDGCPKFCAKKNVEIAGGEVVKSVLVNDALKSHRGEQFGTAAKLLESGWTVACEIAEGIVGDVRTLNAGGDK